jgi:phage repressor protein C with HTH and peptisase S24 domain
VRIRGDSMVPALHSGDYVIIDQSDTNVDSGGNDLGSVIIKQVELARRRSAGVKRIRCTSLNPTYTTSPELTLGEEAMIIGRVNPKGHAPRVRDVRASLPTARRFTPSFF